MADLDTKLRKIDRVTAPDLWGDIGTRTRNLPEGGGRLPTPPTSSGQRVAAATVAFAVFAAAAVFAFRAFGDDARPVGDPVTPDGAVTFSFAANELTETGLPEAWMQIGDRVIEGQPHGGFNWEEDGGMSIVDVQPPDLSRYRRVEAGAPIVIGGNAEAVRAWVDDCCDASLPPPRVYELDLTGGAQIPGEPGRHVLEFEVRWPQGRVTYLWAIEIVEPAPSPVVEPDPGDPATDPGDSEGPPPEPGSPVSLWLSAGSVPRGPVELVAVLVSSGPVDATFGVAAEVERWDEDTWVPYGDLVMCMDHWHCTARIETSGGSGAVPGIGLGASPGSPGPIERFTTEGLEVGWYRISQVANEGVTAAAILEVGATAAEPAPLVSVDAPAISVSPAVVTTRGAEIGLYPLIPAPSGSQSREDIERAIAGLAETARIERWSGSRWRSLGEVQLRRVPGDSLPRSAHLPPLPEGAYRLVRDGAGADHAGQFWVDDIVSP